MSQRLIFVDSKNRDVQIHPNGNAYVLHLTTPIKNVSRVDLVSARVPNCMFNVSVGGSPSDAPGANVFSINTSNVSILPGFYSATSLASALATPDINVDYAFDQGGFVFTSRFTFRLVVNSPEFAKCIGFGTTGEAFVPVLSTSSNLYTLRSTTLIDLSLNEYVFLDIDELKTPWNIDAKAMDNTKGTFSGSNATRMFAPVVMDVDSGSIKNFHECSDYAVSAAYPEPIGTLSRLTVKWFDKDGKSLDFRGMNNNSFVLRVHVTDDEDRRLPPPPPLQDVEIRRIVEAMTYVTPKEEPKKRPRIPWWLIFVVLLSAYVAWRLKPAPAVPAVPVVA